MLKVGDLVSGCMYTCSQRQVYHNTLEPPTDGSDELNGWLEVPQPFMMLDHVCRLNGTPYLKVLVGPGVRFMCISDTDPPEAITPWPT